MRRTGRWVALSAAATGLVWAIPGIAMAAEVVQKPWQATVGKSLGAGLAMGLAALGAGYAQGKIGSAGAGALAERPELATNIIVLQVLPEIIALLGFAIAFVISGL